MLSKDVFSSSIETDKKVLAKAKLFRFPKLDHITTKLLTQTCHADACEEIIDDFLEARRRHQMARTQLRHLLNTFVMPHK